MTYDFDSLFARFTSEYPQYSVSDLAGIIDGDIDNWSNCDRPTSELSSVDGPTGGLFNYDETMWLDNYFVDNGIYPN